MASTRHNLDIHRNQENATAKIPGKTALDGASQRLQPTRRPALNDLQTNQIMGPPINIPGKKVQLPKKNVTVNKENAVPIKKDSKPVPARKPLREESILISHTNRAAILRREAGKALVNTRSSTTVRETSVLQVKEAKEKKPEVSLKIERVEKRIVVPDRLKKDITIIDPDEKSRKDPLLVTEYIEDILAYVRELEINYPIQEKFLNDCKVSPKMRATLVNWLVDVHNNYHFELETLHQCVSLVDRYLMVNKKVEKGIYQLVGTSALLLASKYEELFFPDLSDFVYICDGAFTKKQILQMECNILRKLDYRMGWSTSIYFLRRYDYIARATSEQHTLAKYILELALLEYGAAHIKPSIQAAAACCLSIAILTEVMEPSKMWSPTLIHYTTYKYSDFESTLHSFAHMLKNAETSKFDSVRKKYAQSKFAKISLNFKLEGPLMRKLTTTTTSAF